MKLFLILFFFAILLFGEEKSLDDLLSNYREANELYKQTKEEKSGHVIVFSRSDLDKMQAYTLNDVLKTVRMFTLKNTTFGATSLIKTPYPEQAVSSVKIYIDSYELTSLTAGTGLAQLGKMGLNFIDHIEIYQASNAIAFHGEPGSMSIRLYTKDPSRENATVFQGSGDSKGGLRGQVIDAQNFKEYSYLANADISKSRYDKETNTNGSKLSRDGERKQLYINFSKKNDYLIEAGGVVEHNDIFNGFGSYVQNGGIDSKYGYVQFTKQLPSDMKLVLSTTYETVQVENSDINGIRLFDGSLSNAMFVKVGSYAHDVMLQKRHSYEDHNLLFGAEAKLKTFFLDSLESNGAQKPIALGPKDLDIYMLSFEDAYDINEDHQIVLGVKLDHYNNHATASTLQHILRLAYLAKLSDEFSLKTFIQKGYVYPLFAQTTFSPIYDPNPNLKSSKMRVMKAELEYKKENLTLTSGFGTAKAKDGITFNPTLNMYVNNDEKSDFSQIFVNAQYRFDADNKVVAEYFKAYKEKNTFSSDSGALLQLYTTFERFDIYNELVYRSAYTGVDGVSIHGGYDYTAGIIYHHDKNVDIKLKGENLFDNAIQTSINGAKIPAIERKAILTLEYIF